VVRGTIEAIAVVEPEVAAGFLRNV